ncbi:MAG TPA: hypothetical protein V6D14_10475 [Coleofasciculaceae cyanobacterium]|jgi:hypothetical protein
MNVTIKDIDLLKSIQPQQVAKYLQAKGWQQQRQIADKAIIWLRDNEVQQPIHIVLPLNPEVSDFPVSMNLMLETLETTENRSQTDIFSDLITQILNSYIQGVVMQIHTPNADQLGGKITLIGVVIDKLRKIQAELFNEDYIFAIKAYQERLPIACTGDLIKEDSCFVLKNPRNLALDESWIN